MCILIFQINPAPSPNDYRLVLVSNRDEFYNRPTLTAAPWVENQNIIGGRDMQTGRKGGTWFAVETGHHRVRFGALLNITGDKHKTICPGRGSFVADYLRSSLTSEEFVKNIGSTGSSFNGFNLVAAELSENSGVAYNYCNATDSNINKWTDTNSFVVGVGNSPVEVPLAKVTAGKERFTDIIQKARNKKELIEQLIHFLKWNKSHWPDAELEKRAPNWGSQLSSIFVEMEKEGYGTRTHTIVLVDYDWHLDYIDVSLQERDYGKENLWDQIHIERHL